MINQSLAEVVCGMLLGLPTIFTLAAGTRSAAMTTQWSIHSHN